MSKPLRHKPCIYCGRTGQPAPDHVPPKSLFVDPKPSDLITVPSCYPCNKGFELDDEYFKTTLALRTTMAADASARQLMERVRRGLERPEAVGFADRILGAIEVVQHHGTDGSLIPVTGQWVDGPRVNRFLGRVVRGLFYDQVGEPLPISYRTSGAHFESIGGLQLPILQMVGTVGGGGGQVGGTQFEFLWGQDVDDANATSWLMTFFDRATFAVITAPSCHLTRPCC